MLFPKEIASVYTSPIRQLSLDAWEEVVENAVNIEVKASLQSFSKTNKIDFRCPKDYRSSAKKDKNKTN